MEPGDIILELVERIEELRTFAEKKHDPKWITLNFRVNRTLNQAGPWIIEKVIEMIDGELE